MSSDKAKSTDTKRKQPRYAVSDDCRLKAMIKLRSEDPATAAKDWPGTVVDLSASGAHVHISLGAVAYQGDSCVLTLSHGGIKADLRGLLAHYVCSARYSMCGVSFDTSYSGTEKSYQPFFKAIMASAGLEAGLAGAESAGRYLEEYRGPENARLKVWRDKAGGALLGFDYSIARYGATLPTVGPDMFKNKEQVRFYAVASGGGDAGIHLTKNQELDARWEFSLAASNLPAKVFAADIRRLLRLTS
jgi:hypothetical protein